MSINNFYGEWIESKNYAQESPLENGTYKDFENKITTIIGTDGYDRIYDSLADFGCEVQFESFKQGFGYAMRFIAGFAGNAANA